MALDGVCLSIIAQKLSRNFAGAKLEKVSQPARDCIILSLRHKNGNGKLLISAGATGARIHFTENQPENPQVPPMFCMLLRKHLSGGKLLRVRQLGLDRVLFLDFEVLNELADPIVVTLCVEIMGHNSNIILINENGAIVDSVRRVNADVSSVRFVLPGVKYELPPAQDKKNLFELTHEEIRDDIIGCGQNLLSRALLNLYSGFSPIICRECAFYAARNTDVLCDEMTNDMFDRLFFFISQLKKYLSDPKPTAVYDQNRTPKDFSFFPIHQYGHSMTLRSFDSLDSLLDDFYTERDRLERVRQKSGDLLKTVVNIYDRIARKLANQRNDLEKCKDKDVLRRKGDILYANLSAIQKGQASVRLVDFYDEAQSEIEIALDTRLTPAGNAQRYYNEYRKADTAEKMLTELIKSGESELSYIDSVFDNLTRASSETELAAIREELYEQRYIRKKADKKQMKASIPYLKYLSSDGFTILCGRNNVQNDRLTLREAAKSDIWLHTQKIPGSHTIIITEGKDVPDSTLNEAACIAAYNSKARNSSKVAVDYTAIKNVKKPSGAKPGMVIYDFYKTAVVTPEPEMLQNLAVK